MQALIDVILPVFVLIGFGYLAVWRKYFPESGVDGLMRYTQHFAMPCLLFTIYCPSTFITWNKMKLFTF